MICTSQLFKDWNPMAAFFSSRYIYISLSLVKLARISCPKDQRTCLAYFRKKATQRFITARFSPVGRKNLLEIPLHLQIHANSLIQLASRKPAPCGSVTFTYSTYTCIDRSVNLSLWNTETTICTHPSFIWIMIRGNLEEKRREEASKNGNRVVSTWIFDDVLAHVLLISLCSMG